VNTKIVFFRDVERCGLAVHPDRSIVLPKMEAAKFLLNFGTFWYFSIKLYVVTGLNIIILRCIVSALFGAPHLYFGKC